MRAGEKNRRIRIEVLSTEKSTFGSDAETWALQKEVYAAVRYLSGQEKAGGNGIDSEAMVSFKIDYIAGLSPKTNRIRFNNLIYDIQYISEVGYREASLLTCRVQAITGVGEGIEGSTQRTAPQTIAQLIRGGTVNIASPQNAPLADPVVLVSYAQYPFTIVGINNLKTSSGTITLSLYVNGIAVTGLSGLSVTSTAQHPLATGGNTVAVGDRLVMVLADNASAEDLEFSTKITVQ